MEHTHYIELKFTLVDAEEFVKDLLIDALAAVDYDTFEENENGFCAYIHGNVFSESNTNQALAELKAEYNFSYTVKQIPYENWNQVWESNFEPVVIAGKCYIRASFHEQRPDIGMEVIIDPKMAFGTGHHETTSLMASYLFETNCVGKEVLDMGCGTAVLAIIADKLGAAAVIAIDNDAQAIINAQECIELNTCKAITAFVGDANTLATLQPVDILLANINRNILLDQLAGYAKLVKTGGLLFMSGFYNGADLKIITEKATALGFVYVNHKEKNNWVAAQFKK